jgi:SSS family solute:Na+ symporter
MLTLYDKLVIGFYFVFMTLMSWVMRRFVRNTSDYFRGGGEMLWWIAGAGAFTVSFSAVTFTGMAGKAYTDGPVVMVIFVGNAIGFFINYLWFAPVSRQTRAVTAMQVVRNRFGRVSEQFFTWVQIPSGMLYAGLWLQGLAVFVSAAFNMPLQWTIVVTGSVVIVMALLGGSWSVMAGDFVQMLVLMPVSLVAAVLSLHYVGGVSAFFDRLPSKFYHWPEAGSGNIIALWVFATLLQKFVSTNSMQDASRYLSVKDSKHARKAALLGTILYVIGPVMWFIPPMAARIAHPNIAEMFPKLKNPQEASFFAIAVHTMPAGMVGLLLSAIFGATMSAMDGGLNKNAGFFVKNFYQLYVKPGASERHLLIAGKLTTLCLGVLIILAGLQFAAWKGTNIFEQMTYFSGMVGLPVAVPLVLGLFVRRAPGWAGWSTVLVTLTASLLSHGLLDQHWLAHLLGRPLNGREISDWGFAAPTMVNILVGCTWFLGSCLFAEARPAEEKARTTEFFRMLHTPVDFHKEEGAGSDNLQAKVMGLLCMIYGGFILLLMAIPNPWTGRLAFAFCGLMMGGIGVALHTGSKSRKTREEAAARGVEPEAPEGAFPVIQPAGEVLAEKRSP